MQLTTTPQPQATPNRMSSREVAELTGKNHADVMRDIRALQKGIDESKSGFVCEAATYTGGDGRNTLFLAHKGLHVTAVDIAPEAVANLNRYAARANLQAQIKGVVADIEGFEIEGPFEDIISVFTLHFLPARSFPVVLNRIMEATTIGGINVIEDFTQSGPLYKPDVQGHFLQSGELRRLYEDRGWRVLYYDEGTATTRATDEQGNPIKQGSATIVAAK